MDRTESLKGKGYKLSWLKGQEPDKSHIPETCVLTLMLLVANFVNSK